MTEKESNSDKNHNLDEQKFIYDSDCTGFTLPKLYSEIDCEQPRPIYKSQSKKVIMSYGIIVFAYTRISANDIDTHDNVEPKFLIYQRRDSFEYAEFLRGLWTTHGQVKNLLILMTPDERNRLKNYTFDELWSDLWLGDSRTSSSNYNYAKRKFNYIKTHLISYINSTISRVKETPWGFCKGKKMHNESSLECALREFNEETKLSTKNILIRNDLGVHIEQFVGSNNKIYSSYYHVAQYPQIIHPERLQTPEFIRKSTVSDEVQDVRWITINEANAYLNPRRIMILQKIINKIYSGMEF